MLKKENRLTKNKHFKFIYKKGKSKQTQFLTLVFVRTYFQPFKVGFSVNKKIGKSVVRNLVKRRLRECFKIIQNNVNPNFNYIFVAKPGLDKISFWDLKQEMENILKKAGLLV